MISTQSWKFCTRIEASSGLAHASLSDERAQARKKDTSSTAFEKRQHERTVKIYHFSLSWRNLIGKIQELARPNKDKDLVCKASKTLFALLCQTSEIEELRLSAAYEIIGLLVVMIDSSFTYLMKEM